MLNGIGYLWSWLFIQSVGYLLVDQSVRRLVSEDILCQVKSDPYWYVEQKGADISYVKNYVYIDAYVS
jgi:hypothetical protein